MASSSALKLKYVFTKTAPQVDTRTDTYPESQQLHFGTLSGQAKTWGHVQGETSLG